MIYGLEFEKYQNFIFYQNILQNIELEKIVPHEKIILKWN
jgi:hypothetical protein